MPDATYALDLHRMAHKKPIRLWLDGCFDTYHYAHSNAVRQALTLVPGDNPVHITVGVHSDAEILRASTPLLET